MHKTAVIIMGLVLFLFCCRYGRAEQIVIAVDESNAPFMFYDRVNKRVSGFYPRLVEAVFKRTGISAVIIAYPWKRALIYGESGESGIAGIYKNKKRQAVFDYSNELYVEKIYAYSMKENGASFINMQSFKDKRVGVIRGWSYGSLFDEKREQGFFSADEGNSDIENFQKMILHRKLDCVVAVDFSGDAVIKTLSAENKIKKEKKPVIQLPVYLVFSKKSSRQKTLQIFNKGLSSIKADGTYQKIMTQELGSP